MMLTSQLLLSLSLTAAQPAPEQTKAVFDYYYEGQGKGIVIADAFLCSEIQKKRGEGHNDCTKRAGESAAKGAKVEVYLYYLLPKGDEVDLMVQALHNGVVRETRDVKAKSYSMRSRTWKTFSLKKTGKWEFKVLTGDGKELKALTIDAT